MKYSLKKSHSIWMTGFPSSGKTTISKNFFLEFSKEFPTIILDSDECNKFFFSKRDYSKKERNISTLKYINLVKILLRTKCLIIISANHSFNSQRLLARKILKKNYSELWVSTNIQECKKRDVKKLFLKAKKNKLQNLIGHDLKFEKPNNYDLKIDAKNKSLDQSTKMIKDFLLYNKIIYAKKI
jgi:adenylylsulfate kinase-like enzyme